MSGVFYYQIVDLEEGQLEQFENAFNEENNGENKNNVVITEANVTDKKVVNEEKIENIQEEVKQPEKVEKPVSPVGTMNCTYTSLAAPEGYDTTVNMTLIFNNGALKNYTKIMNVEPTLGQEALAATTVPNLKAAYHQTFDHLTIPGYQIVTNAKTVGFETIVSLDLTTLDITQLNAYHALNVVTKAEFALDDTEEMVMTKATALGYVCQ